MKNKKAINELGIGIIIMGALLLLGALFFDSDSTHTSSIVNIKDNPNNANDIKYGQTPPEEEYVFYLEDITLGRQDKVTNSYPNIELGSKEEVSIATIGNSFRLTANPFTNNIHRINVQFDNPQDIKQYLIYFDPERISGDNPILVKENGREVAKILGSDSDSPIVVPYSQKTNTSTILTFEIEKPSIFNIFNWNKLDMSNVKIAQVKQDKSNNKREFDFEVNKDYLERMYIDLVITCDETKEISEPIKLTLNGFIIANQNPDCTSHYNTITANNISLNILKEAQNRLVLESEGYYKVAFSINKIYYVDEDTFKFNVNSFEDIIDVVMYGDFDKEIIDLRVNSQTMTLRRDEIKSIVSYLKFGTNEIKFLTKPLEIEEFIIEKNEFLS